MSENQDEVYTPEDIQKIMKLKHSSAYRFLAKAEEQKLFKIIRIGTMYRIPKQSFDNWLNE